MDTMFRRAKMLCGAGGLGLKVRIRRMLRQLGLIPNDSGYRYLIEALEIMVATEEPRAIVKDVYAEVARKENVTPVGVESSIRRMLWKIKEQNSELYQEMEALCKGEMSNARLLRLLADRQRSEIEQLEEEGC